MQKSRKGQMASVVTLLIGVIFLVVGVQIATSVNDGVSTLGSATQELTYNTAPASQTFTLTTVQDGVVSSGFLLTNGTTNFTSPDNYNVTSAGSLVFIDTSNQTLTATYSYEPTGYVEPGTTRTVIGFIPLFIGLAALALAAFFVMKN